MRYPEQLNDLDVEILRRYETTKARWNICIKISFNGELIDTEQIFISGLETAAGVNIEIHMRMDQLRRQFMFIL